MTVYSALILVIASFVMGLKGVWRVYGALFVLAVLAIFGGVYWQFGTLSHTTWLETGGDRDLGPSFATGFFSIFFTISLLTFLIGLSIRGIVGQISGMRK